MVMRRQAFLLALLAALAAAGCGASAQPADAVRHYELPNLDALELELPAGWQDAVEAAEDGGMPTLRFTGTTGEAFEVEVIPEGSDAVADAGPDAETLRAAVRDAGERLRPQSVEQTIEVSRLQGTGGVGFYFRVTERAPEADELPCMTQGALQVGRLTLWFSILTRDPRDPAVERALAMLAAAAYRGNGLDRP